MVLPNIIQGDGMRKENIVPVVRDRLTIAARNIY